MVGIGAVEVKSESAAWATDGGIKSTPTGGGFESLTEASPYPIVIAVSYSSSLSVFSF